MRLIQRTADILQEIIRTKLLDGNANKLVQQFLQNISSYALPRDVGSATYEIKNDDFGHTLFFQAACTITFAADLDNAFQCAIVKAGTGDLTFSGTTGKGTIIATQYDPATAIKHGGKVYIFGNLT